MKKNTKKRRWICKILSIGLLILTFSASTFAQDFTVKGKVTEAGDVMAIPGVNIMEKGTGNGTITDLDGNFSLQVASDQATLIISFIGYKSQDVSVGGQSNLNIILVEDIQGLEEIVVVGYGTSKKSDLTGSMASVKEEDFNGGVNSAPEQLIQGRIAGVEIIQNSGEPGAGMTIRIRGTNSIRSGSSPLYVIDGVPIDAQSTSPDGASDDSGIGSTSATSPLNFINPDDIASMDVLKDASACAIYGSRGANGVVIITTKKGKSGESKVSYSTYGSMAKVANKLDVLSASEFISFRESIDRDDDHYDANTNWQDEIFQTAYSQSHNLSINGGTENTSYRASFGYFNQQGIVKTSEMKRYTGRINLSQKALKGRLTVDANITGTQIDERRAPIGSTGGYQGDVLLNALQANPTIEVRDENGEFIQLSKKSRNPIAMLELTDDKTKTVRILGNISANLKIIEGLNYKLNIGVDNVNGSRRVNQSPDLIYITNGGIGNINNKELSSQVVEHTLSYNKEKGKHSFGLLAGYSYQNFLVRGYNISVEGFETDEITFTNKLELAKEPEDEATSYARKDELQSFFGRVNYNYNERYLFTATYRMDGSTKFGENNKYGHFPSVAVAWRASEEEFIKNIDLISNLKVRLGWGQTGNQDIGSKHSLFSLGTTANAMGMLDGESFTPGLVLLRTPSPDITWETTKQLNFGVDFGFFDGRLSGTLDLFSKTTTDILLEMDAISPAPATKQMANIDGKIINKGIELGLTGFIIDKGDFNWTMNVNFAKINNTVEDLPISSITTGRASGSGMTGQKVQVVTNGKAIGEFYGLRFIGYAEAESEIYDKGEAMYEKDEDGVDKLDYLGSPLPSFTYSINNTFQYKAFDFSFFINAVQGNKIYNNTANSIFNVPNIASGRNTSPDAIKTNEGDKNSLKFSDKFIEDGSFIRLSNVTLGYTVPVSSISWLQSLRLYVTGSNLFVITDYSGFDPEVNTDANEENVSSYGIDYTNYPKPRTFMAGLKVTF